MALRALFGDDAGVLRETDFQVLLLANVLAPLGTALLSPAMDSFITPFGVTAADIGLLISVFTAPAIVMIPIAGVLADRFGRKPILLTGITLFGAAGTLIAFTRNFQVALALRLLQGVAFGGISPIIITSIGDLYTGTREATAQGMRFTGSGVTTAVFPFVSGVVVAIAWWYPFLIYAIAFPIAIAVSRWFDEPTTRPTDTTLTANGGSGTLHGVTALLKQPRVASMVLARGLPNMVWIGFITYNSLLVVRLIGGTPAQAGGLVAVASLALAGAASQAGRLTAVFDSRVYPLLGANVLLGVGFAGLFLAPTLLLATIAILITGIGFGVTLALYRSIITGLAPEMLRGSLVSLAEAFGRVTSTITPIAMGFVIATATPLVGFEGALQLAGLGIAGIGGVGGIGLVLAANMSPPVRHS